jgi:NADH:ubiquinone oxidoreductase subunit 4 (subunit M)
MDFDLTFNRYLFLLFIPHWNHHLIRMIAFNTSLLTFLISLLLWIEFNKSTGKLQFMSKLPSVLDSYAGFEYDQYGTLNFIVGIDGISLFSFY